MKKIKKKGKREKLKKEREEGRKWMKEKVKMLVEESGGKRKWRSWRWKEWKSMENFIETKIW